MVLLCGPSRLVTWPVAAVAVVAGPTCPVPIVDVETDLRRELDALLPVERAGVRALVRKWGLKRPHMYITRFHALFALDFELDLRDPGLGLELPYVRACNALPTLNDVHGNLKRAILTLNI